MAGKQAPKGSAERTASKPAKAPAGKAKFSAEERAAMRERARELKSAANAQEAEKEVLAKIAAMRPADRAMAKRVHAMVRKAAPHLTARTWYGMPAYAKDGKIVCFFQDSGKFKARYSTFGFAEAAKLDSGEIWPTSYAVTKLTPEGEKRLAALVKKAAR